MSLEQVVEGDDYRASLVELRNYLARSLDECDSLRDRASLAARLQAVLADIEAIPNKSKVSAADEIAARRDSRRAGSARSART